MPRAQTCAFKMYRRFSCLVCLLLVPCLIADLTSASLSTEKANANRPSALRFLCEAITPPVLNVGLHPDATITEYQLVDPRSRVTAPPQVQYRPQPPPYDAFVEQTDRNQLRQSFSGIRAIGEDGNDVFASHSDLLAFSIYAYFYALNRMDSLGRKDGQPLRLVLAGDPRPSGDIVRQALAIGISLAARERGARIQIENLGILTTPIVESAVRTLKCDGGVMITASHNPVKDNGIKFMTAYDEDGPIGGGALLNAEVMDGLIRRFDEIRKSRNRYRELSQKLMEPADVPPVNQKLVSHVVDQYIADLRRLFPGTDLVKTLHGIRVAVDPNGGAGSLSVSGTNEGLIASVLSRLGMCVNEVITPLGETRHDIEPKEGSDGLKSMRKRLDHSHVPFGVVFDWDADRGTTALPDMDLEPQDVSAFNVAVALSWMDAYRQADDREVVVIAHDATSKAVEKIAALFSKPHRPVRIRRVEVGEINVVSAMQEERRRGHYVPIGVEGSNGGTILGDATCRDGVATALLMGLAIGDAKVRRVWSAHFGAGKIPEKLSSMVSRLPSRCNVLGQITGVNIAKIPAIKSAMEQAFRQLWDHEPFLKQRYSAFEFQHYEGTERLDRLHGQGMGGWAIVLKRWDGQEDFIWMRPSRTEPYLRHMIDAVDASSFQMLQRIFEVVYTGAQQESVFGNHVANSLRGTDTHELMTRRVNFSIHDDIEARDWLESREKKRDELLSSARLQWQNTVDPKSIADNIRQLAARLLRRREQWYRDQEIPYAAEELRQSIFDQSPRFILEELIANAFDAYVAEHAEGPVELRIARRGDNIMMEVSDNGVGIAEVLRDADGSLDFRSYRSKPQAQMHKRQGGKGIAIDWSNILMHLHGGSLEAWTPGLHGYKTTVRITIPESAIRFNWLESGPSVVEQSAESRFGGERAVLRSL